MILKLVERWHWADRRVLLLRVGGFYYGLLEGATKAGRKEL